MDLRQPRRILLCWEYHRRVWREPFDRLAARYAVELHFLAFRTQEEELPGSEELSHPRSFWRDYADARSVIERIQPDEIVFMGLDGAWSIALNHVARRSGIPTAFLHHGTFFPPAPQDRDALPEATDRRPRAPVSSSAGWSRLPALRFLARSMARQPVTLLHVLRWLRAVSSDPRRPPRFLAIESRLPDRYLVTGSIGAEHVLSSDGTVGDRIVLVGVPEYDRLLSRIVPRHLSRSRVVLIDTPFTGTRYGAGTVDPLAKAASILRLTESLQGIGLDLVLKLHPESYGDAWPPDHPNLVVVRDEDPVKILTGAVLAVGFDSTLLGPFAARLPVIIVRTRSWLASEVGRLGAGPVVDDLDDITADLVQQTIARAGETLAAREALARGLVTELDGRALERLGAALGLRHRASPPETAAADHRA